LPLLCIRLFDAVTLCCYVDCSFVVVPLIYCVVCLQLLLFALMPVVGGYCVAVVVGMLVYALIAVMRSRALGDYCCVVPCSVTLLLFLLLRC
jgi:hypothetical protein